MSQSHFTLSFPLKSPADAKVLAKAILGHWGVENGLHWVLDMYFGEDRSRARTEHAASNLAVLRRWILTMLRQDKTLKDGIEKKRLQAGWNEAILEKMAFYRGRLVYTAGDSVLAEFHALRHQHDDVARHSLVHVAGARHRRHRRAAVGLGRVAVVQAFVGRCSGATPHPHCSC